MVLVSIRYVRRLCGTPPQTTALSGGQRAKQTLDARSIEDVAARSLSVPGVRAARGGMLYALTRDSSRHRTARSKPHRT